MVLLDNVYSFGGLIALVVICFLLFLFLALISETIHSFIELVVGRPLLINFMLFPKKLDPHSELLLNNNFPFYRKLKYPKKRVFASRVAHFMKDKNFRIDAGISEKQLIKVLVAATVVRVTFGLRNYLFLSFHTIVVHAEPYFSRYTKSTNKGETNSAGFIVFSWKDFLFGLKDDEDSLNLGYHEFAHALYIEHIKVNMEAIFSRNMEKWNRFVKNNSKLKEVKDHKFFREYATYNTQEFFAVSVENFFEKPKQFKTDLPRLYKLMVNMLNQTPLQKVKHRDQFGSFVSCF